MLRAGGFLGPRLRAGQRRSPHRSRASSRPWFRTGGSRGVAPSAGWSTACSPGRWRRRSEPGPPAPDPRRGHRRSGPARPGERPASRCSAAGTTRATCRPDWCSATEVLAVASGVFSASRAVELPAFAARVSRAGGLGPAPGPFRLEPPSRAGLRSRLRVPLRRSDALSGRRARPRPPGTSASGRCPRAATRRAWSPCWTPGGRRSGPSTGCLDRWRPSASWASCWSTPARIDPSERLFHDARMAGAGRRLLRRAPRALERRRLRGDEPADLRHRSAESATGARRMGRAARSTAWRHHGPP